MLTLKLLEFKLNVDTMVTNAKVSLGNIKD